MMQERLITLLHDKMSELLLQTLNSGHMSKLIPHLENIMGIAVQQAAEDLVAYAKRDPASGGQYEQIANSYISFKAVLFYRLAHQVWLLKNLNDHKLIAQHLANAGKLYSGVDIHPAATIGRRFVLDHGFGTVIGETSEIGDDCYLLSNVTLGASGIADNPNGKRHPKLGSGVEVGAGARILGAVTIGDNVFVSPACVITRDIPANTRTSIVNQLQIHRTSEEYTRRYICAFSLGNRLHLIGELPEIEIINVLDADHRRLESLVFDCTVRENYHYQFHLRKLDSETLTPLYPLHLQICGIASDMTLLDPPGLNTLVHSALEAKLASAGS